MKLKVHFLSLCAVLLTTVICFSGCKTTTITNSRQQNQGKLSIQVTLNEDGSFTYIGDNVSRKDLPRVLRKATSEMGRSITVKAGDNVEKKALIEARQFLVYNGFPNVTIVTKRIAVSYEEELKDDNKQPVKAYMADENILDKNMTSSPKLRILLVHNRYKLRGGEDSVFEAERDMLVAAGHNVHIYEVTNDTIDCCTSKLKLFLNTIWSNASYKAISQILDDFKPDVVHCHNTFPLISPSIYYACDKAGVPVVQTLHNYRLTCLNGYLFREQECQLCEKCLGKAPIRGVFKRCYRNSLAASATVAAMLIVHRMLGTYRKKVTKYIALSHFAKYNFTKKCGLPEDKVVVKPNIVTLPKEIPQLHKGKNVLFVGRISPEKGVKTLISAWNLLKDTFGFKLIIIGNGPEKDTLSQKYQNNKSISFLGELPHDEVIIQLTKASLLVFPSILYEQFAITPIEAMSQATPVLVSDIAKNATIIQDNISGRYFKAGDINDLAAKFAELLSDTNKLITLGTAAKAAFEKSDCSLERNLRALEAIYHTLSRQISSHPR